jgi:RNA polymerase sigma-70 factor (ECF subfamily)
MTSQSTNASAIERRGKSADSHLIREAIADAQTGDVEALHFLYARYSSDVLKYVRSLVEDHHEAEDITQSVFVKLTSSIRRYEPRDVPFSAWILRVARNAALDYLRARRMIPCEEVRVQGGDQAMVGHERGKDLRRALEQLPGEQQEVLILRHIAGLTPLEIADRLGKSESSVHGLHHRGRRSLQAALEDLGAVPVVAPRQMS